MRSFRIAVIAAAALAPAANAQMMNLAAAGVHTLPSYDAMGLVDTRLADVTGDGRSDIVLRYRNTSQFAVLKSLGDAAWSPPVVTSSAPFLNGAFALGDVNGDGRADVVAMNYTPTYALLVFHGQATGGFTLAWQSAITNTYSSWIDLQDVTGDGRLDAIINKTASTGLYIRPGLANGTFGPAVLSDTLNGFPVYADIDGDGKLDYVAERKSNDPTDAWTTITTFKGNGAGAFTQTDEITLDVLSRDIALRDMDGDSLPELVVFGAGDTRPTSGGMYVVRNQAGRFNPLDGGVPRPEFLTRITHAALPMWSATIADYSGDGRPDAALIRNSGELRLLENDGAGKLEPARTIQTGVSNAFHLLAGEYAGHALPDLIVRRADFTFGGQSLHFYRNAKSDCMPNCDSSTASPALNVLDFNCFLNAFAAGKGYANCDGSTEAPVHTVLDFNCFMNRFAAGCP